MTAPIKPPVVSLHQHMTQGYEDRKALKAEAGFAPDTLITAGDLRDAEFRRIDASASKLFAKARPWDGFYRHGGVR